MQPTHAPIEIGWNVYDRDGEKIGSVSEVGPNYVLVQKGLIFVKDIYVPMDSVTGMNPAEQAVGLSVRKDDIEQLGWDAPPAWAGAPSAATAATQGDEGFPEDLSVFRGTGEATSGEALSVPVHREELQATAVPRTTQAAVRKDVVEERQSIEVPVTHDELEVRRVPVDRPATPDEAAFQAGDTVRVPLREDQVVVDKQTRVVEEVHVARRPVTETQRVEDTVRREEVTVDRGDTIGVRDDAGRSLRDPSTREPELAGAGAGVDRFQRAGDWDATDGRPGDEHYEVAGGAVGGVAGAAAGAAVGGPVGAVVGGVVGAAGGAAAGEAAEDDADDLDDQERRDTTTLY
jgi:uncharacterized protein (TIGR02271 family)